MIIPALTDLRMSRKYGMLVPIPPTGNRVTVKGATLGRYVGGKYAEEWEHQDWLGFMQQLGLAPPPGGSG